MSVLIIFWAALFCLIFFFLGTVIKIIESGLIGLLASGEKFLESACYFIGLEIFLFCLYCASDTYMLVKSNPTLGVIFTVLIFLIFFIISSCVFAAAIMVSPNITVFIVLFIELLSNVLSFAAGKCEKAYAYFLSVILKRLDNI